MIAVKPHNKHFSTTQNTDSLTCHLLTLLCAYFSYLSCHHQHKPPLTAHCLQFQRSFRISFLLYAIINSDRRHKFLKNQGKSLRYPVGVRFSHFCGGGGGNLNIRWSNPRSLTVTSSSIIAFAAERLLLLYC